MPPVTDLPNETLLQVVDDVKYVDIEAFALTCRAFYSLAEKKLIVHRQRKRQYTTFTVKNDPLDRLTQCSLLVRDILISLDIATYVTVFRIRDPDQSAESTSGQELRESEAKHLLARHGTLIDKALHDCAYLGSRYDAIMRWSPKKRYTLATPLLLITLLPNLRLLYS